MLSSRYKLFGVKTQEGAGKEMIMAGKTPHTSCSFGEKAKLRKGGKVGARRLGHSRLGIPSVNGSGQIELADIPAGRATWVSPRA